MSYSSFCGIFFCMSLEELKLSQWLQGTCADWPFWLFPWSEKKSFHHLTKGVRIISSPPAWSQFCSPALGRWGRINNCDQCVSCFQILHTRRYFESMIYESLWDAAEHFSLAAWRYIIHLLSCSPETPWIWSAEAQLGPPGKFLESVSRKDIHFF